MKKKNIKIIKGLIDLNGEEAALKKVGEECQELALAITQYFCPTKTNKKKRLNDIHKEAADVKNVIRMLDELSMISKSKINRLQNKKLKEKQIKYLNNKK